MWCPPKEQQEEEEAIDVVAEGFSPVHWTHKWCGEKSEGHVVSFAALSGGEKDNSRANVVHPNQHCNVKMLKWAQLMTRGRTIGIHDNPLKQFQVCCDVLWQGRKIIYDSLLKHSCVGHSDFIVLHLGSPVWHLSTSRLLAVITTPPETQSPPLSMVSVLRYSQRVCLRLTAISISSTDNQRRGFCETQTPAAETTNSRKDARTVSAVLWNICRVWASLCSLCFLLS